MIEIERRRRGVVVREGRDGYVTRGGRQKNVREEKEYGWGGERKVVEENSWGLTPASYCRSRTEGK